MVTLNLTDRQFEIVKELVHTTFQMAEEVEFEELRDLEQLMQEGRKRKIPDGASNSKRRG